MKYLALLGFVLASSSVAFADQGPDYQAGFSAGFAAGQGSCDQQLWTCLVKCVYGTSPTSFAGNGYTKASAYLQLLTTTSNYCSDPNVARVPANVTCTQLVGN